MSSTFSRNAHNIQVMPSCGKMTNKLETEIRSKPEKRQKPGLE